MTSHNTAFNEFIKKSRDSRKNLDFWGYITSTMDNVNYLVYLLQEQSEQMHKVIVLLCFLLAVLVFLAIVSSIHCLMLYRYQSRSRQNLSHNQSCHNHLHNLDESIPLTNPPVPPQRIMSMQNCASSSDLHRNMNELPRPKYGMPNPTHAPPQPILANSVSRAPQMPTTPTVLNAPNRLDQNSQDSRLASNRRFRQQRLNAQQAQMGGQQHMQPLNKTALEQIFADIPNPNQNQSSTSIDFLKQSAVQSSSEDEIC